MVEVSKIDIRSKRFVWRLWTMMHSGLISYKHYYPWADALIAELDNPSVWLLEIAVARVNRDAMDILSRYLSHEPFEEPAHEERSDEHVACYFLQYRSRAISLASFLSLAGDYADPNGGSCCCEYFYALLNELEDSEYSPEIELRISSEIEERLSEAISIMSLIYNYFMIYFRKHVEESRIRDA